MIQFVFGLAVGILLCIYFSRYQAKEPEQQESVVHESNIMQSISASFFNAQNKLQIEEFMNKLLQPHSAKFTLQQLALHNMTIQPLETQYLVQLDLELGGNLFLSKILDAKLFKVKSDINFGLQVTQLKIFFVFAESYIQIKDIKLAYTFDLKANAFDLEKLSIGKSLIKSITNSLINFICCRKYSTDLNKLLTSLINEINDPETAQFLVPMEREEEESESDEPKELKISIVRK
ncbi:Hypothetical_protein [Hexamita inflata]|uniref:Hypothetical_protein n=1 Tax=Hexamita inflata TaxID=28002 RepID=A0AA86S204_9EUKA|nr:Hypothetical protein HINF_LOCUS64255 [Hexamita inflata]